MSLRHLHRSILLLTTLGASCAALHAQSDLVAPKLREKVVADAVRIAAERGVIPPMPAPLPNPFVAKESQPVEDHTSSTPAVVEPTLAGAELLATVAARIPATGTVVLGGEPILLVGQKRLKVGDVITISFEGQTYELSIAAVTSTSFTVKRGENLHTRPVRISVSSANTPNNRP